MKRTQIYPFRANPTKCNNQYQNVQTNAPPLRPAAVPVHSFPGFSDILPRSESFFLLNNWTFEYILHFSDMIRECLSDPAIDRLSVLCHFHSPDLYSVGEKAAYLLRSAGPKKFHPAHSLCLRIRFMPFYVRFRPCRCRFKMVRYAKSCGLSASHQV